MCKLYYSDKHSSPRYIKKINNDFNNTELKILELCSKFITNVETYVVTFEETDVFTPDGKSFPIDSSIISISEESLD